VNEVLFPLTICADTGLIDTVCTTWFTVSDASPRSEPAVAEIVTVPFDTALAIPNGVIGATAGLELDHETGTGTILPPASNATAVYCKVAPSAVSVATGGRATSRTGGPGPNETVNDAPPVIPFAVAVMAVTPAPVAVAIPLLFTVATEVLELLHWKMTPGMIAPWAVTATALNSCPFPSAVSVAADGVTMIDPKPGPDSGTVTMAESARPPNVATTIARPAPTAVAMPDSLTVATSILVLDQDGTTPATTLSNASRTLAVNVIDPPNKIIAESGVTTMLTGVGSWTVTNAEPTTPPDVAKMVL
jgi:hypothetical protein